MRQRGILELTFVCRLITIKLYYFTGGDRRGIRYHLERQKAFSRTSPQLHPLQHVGGRLFLSVGFLNIKDEEILLYRVRDISSSRSLGQRIFGVGTVTVTSSDKTCPTLVLKNIKRPLQVKELLHTQVEEMKMRRRVRVGEIMTGDLADDDSDLDDTN